MDFKNLTQAHPQKSVSMMVEMYTKLILGAKWNNEQKEKGVDISANLPAFRRLENDVDMLWKSLSQDQRKEAVGLLIKQGKLPEKLRVILNEFDGKVVTLLK